MAFLRSLLTSRRLQKYKRTLIEEKLESIKYERTKKRGFKFSYFGVKIQQGLKQLWSRVGYCCCCKRFCFNLKHSGSVQNYVLKSILGFFGGLFLTYIFFLFFIFQLNLSFYTATIVCSIMGCILVNGLAFSTQIRCVVFLTLPHFFSERGRQLLVAYVLILVVSGPVKNTLNNLGILSESLACGQEQLKSIVKQIIEVIKKPFYALKDAIKKVIETVRKIIKKIKEILIKIKRIVMAILRVIKAAFMFLAKIINICNKELGTPFERCTRVFDNAIADCNAKLGSLFSWMCSITYIVKSVCYIVKIFDFVCMIVDFIKDSIIGVVVRKIKGFVRHIRTMFYVRIKFSHSFHFESTSSKSIAKISKDILNEIKDRTRILQSVFNFFTSTASLFFIFMIVKVIVYRYRFLTSDSFDNKYITNDFFKIDMRRAKINKETVLPLNSRERKIYVKIKSSTLTDVEKKKLKKAIMTLATINMKAAMYIGIDYCLYWVLSLISIYGRFQSKVQAPNIPTPHISGKGLLADLLKSIVMAFQPMGLQIEIDTIPCLPTPIPPDLDRYIQILTLLILCWVLTVLEPYGLRFRTYIMCFYHPLRGKQRAIWLYNNILRKRSSFLKFARRQLRRTVLRDKGVDKVTIAEFLAANFRCLATCLDKKQLACLLCGKIFRENDTEKPIKCQTPNCPGLYCEECFADLRNLCTVCLSPIEYGDLSDLSEEKDSSDEAPQMQKKKVKGRQRGRCRKLFNICAGVVETTEEGSPKRKGFFARICCRKPKVDIEEIPLYRQKSKSEVSSEEEDSEEQDMEAVNLLENTTDSGQITGTGTSSDHSFSYQYTKDESVIDRLEIPSKDIEKQTVLDYASMESFRDEQYQGNSSENEDNEEDGEVQELLRESRSVDNIFTEKSSSEMTSKEIILDYASMESFRDEQYQGNSSENEDNEEDGEVQELLRESRSVDNIFTEKSSSEMTSKEIILDYASMETFREESDQDDIEEDREVQKLLPGSVSSEKSFTEMTSSLKPRERLDVGTTISGETMALLKQGQHIEFIGVKNSDIKKSKIKRKRKNKAKYDAYISSGSDSEEIDRYLKRPLVRKSTTFTNTKKGRNSYCSCRQDVCHCNLSEEPNSIDSFPFISSTEYSSSLGHQKRDVITKECLEVIQNENTKKKDQQKRKPNRLKMFMRKVIPKVNKFSER